MRGRCAWYPELAEGGRHRGGDHDRSTNSAEKFATIVNIDLPTGEYTLSVTLRDAEGRELGHNDFAFAIGGEL